MADDSLLRVSQNTQILLVHWSFWLSVIVLDVAALLSLRWSRLDATATVLWAVWICLAPVVGALSYFLVRPRPTWTARGSGLG